jgi:hypothetical protein
LSDNCGATFAALDKFGVDNCDETNAAADYCGARQMRRTDTEKGEKNQTTKTFLHKKISNIYLFICQYACKHSISIINYIQSSMPFVVSLKESA